MYTSVITTRVLYIEAIEMPECSPKADFRRRCPLDLWLPKFTL